MRTRAFRLVPRDTELSNEWLLLGSLCALPPTSPFPSLACSCGLRAVDCTAATPLLANFKQSYARVRRNVNMNSWPAGLLVCLGTCHTREFRRD